jgi:large subunit ribosomal protein L31e
MVEEKILTLNLRRYFIKVPRWKRASFTSHLLKKILERRLKEKVKINKQISEKIWKRGGERPPGKIRIKLIKIKEGYKAELA